MGNTCCQECTEYIHNEKYIEKQNTNNIELCGYPFCNVFIKNLPNKSLLVEFNGIVYCSSRCRVLHKQSGYIGIGWNMYGDELHI